MWSTPKLKELNGPESEEGGEEENWSTNKSLCYELIDLLEKARFALSEVDSLMQASYHVCHDISRHKNPDEMVLIKEISQEIASIGSRGRKEKANVLNLEVKAWVHYSNSLKEKNKKNRKKKKE